MRFKEIATALIVSLLITHPATSEDTMTAHNPEITTPEGQVMAPWEYLPGVHPLSMGWRMGGGESYLMAFWPWWQDQAFSEAKKIQFFLERKPPAAWLLWVAETIDGDMPDINLSIEQRFDKQAASLENWGFEGVDEFLNDFADPEWK